MAARARTRSSALRAPITRAVRQAIARRQQELAVGAAFNPAATRMDLLKSVDRTGD
jgi:hypothetical protein